MKKIERECNMIEKKNLEKFFESIKESKWRISC